MFLDTVCHRTGQQFAADAMRRFGAIEQSPLLLQPFNRKRSKRASLRESASFESESVLPCMRCPPLFGRHTHCSCWGRQPVIRTGLRGLAPQSLPFPFAFQSLPSMPPPNPANSRSRAPGWKSKETIRFTRRREQTSHRARCGSGGLSGNGKLEIGKQER